MLADFRVFKPYVDFVFGDYIDHVVVVCDDVYCCCVHAFNGDILVFRNYMVVCYAVWPNGDGALMLLLLL